MRTNEILVVDDEVGIRELLSEILRDEGYQVRLAENATEARSYRQQAQPDLVLLDIWMPDTDGISLLKEWSSTGLLTMPVVMMSGHGTIDTAVEATKIGAVDFLEKPIALQKLLATVGRALKRNDARRHNSADLAGLGKAPAINELKKRLAQIAAMKVPLLLTGEPGCGADLCARFLHQPSTPWLAPSGEMFADNPFDLLSQARDGLLYIGEVADLNKSEQKGLLLALSKLDKYNVRLICVSAKPLFELTQSGLFHADLYQALSGLTLAIPSLREHREDIPDLANLILTRLIETKQASMRHFNTAALNALRNYNWPGNLAQLENVVKTLALTALAEEISHEEVNQALNQFKSEGAAAQAMPLDMPLREARDVFERVYFEHHMRLESGNMSRIAEKVGLERTHLYRKLRQLGMTISRKSDE